MICCSQFLLRSRSREHDLIFDRDLLGCFLLPCLFSRDFDVALGDLERVLFRFLERLLDLYFFNFPFLLVRDLDNDLLLDLRLGDTDLRFLEVDLDLDLLLEIDRLLESDLLLGDLRRDRDNDLLEADLPAVFE